MRRPQRPELPVRALQVRLQVLAAQRVLLDELVAGAAVQAQLQAAAAIFGKVQRGFGHADGKGQVAAHAPDDDGDADVAGLNLHVATHTRAAALGDRQAAALAAAPSPVLKGERQVFCGGLVNFLFCTTMICLEDNGDL